MLASLIVVFREVLEAGLIIGIVLAATKDVPRRGLWIAGGIAAGIVGAGLVAGFADVISASLEGMGQEIFTATILLLAVLMLSWHVIWMAKHGREMARDARSLGRSVAAGDRSLPALAIVVAVAVLREGSEIVLFLYGVAVSSHDSSVALLSGGMLGIGAGALVSLLLYRGLLAIPVRHLFRVTHWMIALLAAGMAGQAASLLAANDLLPSWGDQLWDSSAVLPVDSLIGRALHALIGYSDRPSGIQLAAWVGTLIVLTSLARLVGQGAPSKAMSPAIPVPSH